MISFYQLGFERELLSVEEPDQSEDDLTTDASPTTEINDNQVAEWEMDKSSQISQLKDECLSVCIILSRNKLI